MIKEVERKKRDVSQEVAAISIDRIGGSNYRFPTMRLGFKYQHSQFARTCPLMLLAW